MDRVFNEEIQKSTLSLSKLDPQEPQMKLE